MPATPQNPAFGKLFLLTIGLAIAADVLQFSPDQSFESDAPGFVLNHALNTVLWLLISAVVVTVSVMFWHLSVDIRHIRRRDRSARD